ncbi:unnamed protein product [Fraxinus pennsylvanica]|uniref:Uncharacterized protein n=1 Tax=Fraxinus pennsylvanica TaxID=56036 RepID=A0AAD1ZS85_9LAMI|nr:unnamed protein product [Fraxinus pennsylvanica]
MFLNVSFDFFSYIVESVFFYSLFLSLFSKHRSFVFLRHLTVLSSWDGGGIDGSKVVEKGQERVNMVVNFKKLRSGCFQIREEGGEIFVSLLNMKKRFTFLKAVDMEKVIYDIIEKFELTSFLAYS